ncbi:protein bicaudal C homolog 1 [Daktulosphaira vitifoliae]|uniref:protein bicaudal C homolog 1 n=1 Tax=Daktulosphaira vitifoliae TaxID=58002 RepID=UPI0021AACDA3|nr:protein bicaudal C homolog 1 [Daktulosphaira vitifoliae]
MTNSTANSMAAMSSAASSDTMSEVSDSGTGTSGRSYSDSREEMHQLAITLGLESTEDLAKERFKVDRKKLEAMLHCDGEDGITAVNFFQKVMTDTRTLILWPTRLKIGAKSKKDPHVRIAGLPDDVKAAKMQVMSVLDDRSNRVTMKLDLSYTDHSHIIGRGGLTIKQVMENTGCHIHFPDSNRTSLLEKSNQVSIAGNCGAVERARARVRELTPLIFCFDWPNIGTVQNYQDPSSQFPYIGSIQENYNVHVMFRTRPKLHSTMVMVKGHEWDVVRVKEATMQLITHMCGNLASQVLILMVMEISPQHHKIVMGPGNETLRAITRRTGAQILFPDAKDPNIPSIKKSSVTITGHIHNVYAARQMLIGSLPLLLMFDIPQDEMVLTHEQIDSVMQRLDIHISLRHKASQNIYTVSIKGFERSVGNIYEGRRCLLGGTGERISPNIPNTYNVSNENPSFLISNGEFYGGNRYPNRPFNNLGGLNNFTNFAGPMTSSCRNSVVSLPLVGSHTSIPQINVLGPRIQQLANDLKMDNLSTNNNHVGKSTFNYNLQDSANSSPNQSLLSNSELDQEMIENRAPGFRRQPITYDYQHLRVDAARVSQAKPNRSEIRVPTSVWSGYGFSQSSPSALLKGQRENEQNIWSNNSPEANAENTMAELMPMEMSNHLDSTPTSTVSKITSSSFTDLPSHLAMLGLDKYINLFKSHEIDWTTFKTLTESDLREIGVTALGARRKILLSIAELNKRCPVGGLFGISPAPGAERKSPASNNSPSDAW